jgi:hypothetical protein
MMNDGTVIRDGQEPHVRCEQGLFSSEPSAKGASARSTGDSDLFARAAVSSRTSPESRASLTTTVACTHRFPYFCGSL